MTVELDRMSDIDAQTVNDTCGDLIQLTQLARD
jgi:hypothetical protein